VDVRQNLRFKLDNKARSVLQSREENFSHELKIFYNFVRTNNLLNAIHKEIESVEFDLDKYLSNGGAVRRSIMFPDNYAEKIALCNVLMVAFANKELGCLNSLFINITPNNNVNSICNEVAAQYFFPLFECFCERIEDNSTMLYLLDRYRHRVEWFHKDRLYQSYTDNTTHGEDILTKDLQEYLHSQGIDYPFSTPLSPSGRSDLIGLLESADPLVLEVKLFDLDRSYGKEYIRKGLTQAYRYALDYGKPIGYLLIYNLDKRDISFEKLEGETVKNITIGDKTIYIIVVNVFNHHKSASQLKKPLPYIIEDSYLKNLDDED